MPALMQIAIVGAGASGTFLALQLADRMAGRCRVVLFDRSAQFGRGVAYSATADWHRLNVPSSKMGGRRDGEESGFSDWLARKGHPAPTDYSSAFVSRALYGDYLRELLDELVASGFAVTRREAVVAVKTAGAQHVVVTEGGDAIAADAVVLCIGNPPPHRLEGIPESARHIGDVWQADALAPIAPQDRVLLIGTGATGIDAMLDLVHRGVGRHIVMLSRRGLLPCLDAPPDPYPPFEHLDLDTPNMRALMRALRREVAVGATRGFPWQSVLDSFRQHVGTIWRRSSDAERRRFLRHLRSIWLVHRHRLPPDVAEQIARLQAEGRVSIVAGRLRSVTATADGFRGTIVEQGTRERPFAAEWIVNCTGPDERYARLDDPLVRHLFASGMGRPGPMELGLDVNEAGLVLDKDGHPQPGLFALGPPTRGRFWEITAVPWIRAQAARIAAQIELHTCLIPVQAALRVKIGSDIRLQTRKVVRLQTLSSRRSRCPGIKH